MKTVVLAQVLSNKAISGDIGDIYDMTVKAPQIADNAVAGQFVGIYADRDSLLLPRPISICEIEADKGILRFVYQKIGKGTEYFSKLKACDSIKILGPSGNGYMLNDNISEHIIVGGGIGIPPLLELTKRLKGKKSAVLGFRSSSFLVDEFKKYADDVYIASDDGSVGFKGNAVELLKSLKIKGKMIYSCGPRAMLRSLSIYAHQEGIPCQVSMEERMACTIGACVGCSIKIKNDDDWIYKKVCKDGPVFDSEEVIWE